MAEINITATLDDKGVVTGVKNINSAFSGLRKSVQSTGAVVGKALSAPFKPAINLAESFANKFKLLFKKAFILGLLAFIMPIAQLMRDLRETVGQIVNIQGGELKQKVEDLKNKYTELKFSIAAAFLPLVEAAIPYLQKALDWLIKVFNYVGMITAAFLGQKQVLQVIPGSAQKLAKSTKETEKAAKGVLAAFDEINTLQMDAAQAETNPAMVSTQMVPITDDILSRVQAIKDEIAAWWADPIGKIQETWGKIAGWFKSNVIDPISEWWRNTWVSQNIVQPMMDVLVPAFEWIRVGAVGAFGLLLAEWGKITAAFQEGGATAAIQEAFRALFDFIGKVVIGFVALFDVEFAKKLVTIAANPLDFIRGKFIEVFTTIQTFVVNTVNNITAKIRDMVNSVLETLSLLTGLKAPSLPGVGGATGSVSLPHLATGAVIPPNAAFAAVLGDNKSEPEVVSPLSMIRQAVQEALGGSDGMTLDLTVLLDGEVIYKNQQKVARRRGTSLVSGGVA